MILVAGLGMLAAAMAVAPPTAEEELWQRIQRHDSPATQDAWFAEAMQYRRHLLDDVRLYLKLYPGGVHHEEAVAIELETMFEIGTLNGGNLDELRQRVRVYMAGNQPDAVRQEAAYWAMICRRTADVPSTRPTESVETLDSGLLRDYRDYLSRYPDSRHTPRIAAALFDQALRDNDLAEMRRLSALMVEHQPEGLITETIKAQLARVEAVGKPFELHFAQPGDAGAADNAGINAADYDGVPVLVVVWAGSSSAARDCLGAIESYRREHERLRVVGVSLDPSRAEAAAVCGELGVAWPQVHDGLGWATWFARRWGIRDVPTVFVRDRRGVLRGVADAEGWRKLADQIVDD
ncbi:MAG: hypothetical protein JXO22_15790 [Phycisphaerae bacterium]|nr:hypothetical protein [Phycisphaerae bacterium]